MRVNWLISMFLVVVFLTFLNGCSLDNQIKGNGNVVSQERTASDFYNVILDGVGDVNIHNAENYRVTVTTDSNIQDIITITVNGNNLHIDGKKTNNGFSPTKLVIDVYLPEIKSIELNGVGNIGIINGKESNLEIKLSGVGNINGQNYEAENVSISLSGVGDIRTWATKNLTGSISGVGNVLYKGEPTINVNTNITGNIKKL